MQNLIDKIRLSLKEESIRSNVDGWIFTNFSHRDSLTDNLLKLDKETVSTRRWVYIVFKDSEPLKILHKIEPNILNSLPGNEKFFSGQDELLSILKESCQNKTFAMLTDKNISVISTVENGFIELLKTIDVKVCSAASLIQRAKGLLTEEGIKSQIQAAKYLYQIVFESYDLIKKHFDDNLPLYERDIQYFIIQRFIYYNLVTDHAPIVAFGKNSGNPHYEVPETNSALCKKGDVIQLDLWAKVATANTIYADISWVFIYDTSVPSNIEQCFSVLCQARDCVIPIVNKSFAKNEDICGATLDQKVRQILITANYKDGIKHRTGHGIDTACHGSGANLDSVEFPDYRPLLEKSSFSVEPGLYFDDFGLRTEIDVTINNSKAFIPGQDFATPNGITIPQNKILTM